MHTHWLRYLWILLVLFVLAIIAVLFSMSVPRGGTVSPALVQAQQAFNNNDLDGALAASERALASNPNDIDALLAKATTLAQKGSLEFKEKEYGEQAIAVAGLVLALDASNADAWRIIGYANEIMQNYPAAHDAYAQASALAPEDALTIAQEAHAYDLQGDMELAEAGYRRALALEPSLAAANLGLSRVLVYQGREEEALPLLEYVAKTPGNARQRAEAAYSAGQICEMTGNYAAAEALFRSATTIDPQYALGWTGLAMELFRHVASDTGTLSAEKKSSLISESQSALEKALALNPNQSLANYQFAIALIAMDRRSDALIVLKGLQKQIIDALSHRKGGDARESANSD
jgi:tetratricopeptide (TPR) repeat protein